jgi:tripartite-type tricarboxylate transporter receptor subunit TctC
MNTVKHWMMPCLLAAACVALPGAAFAQAYPAKPIRLLVPFAPSGPADVMSRVLAKRLSENLGQQVLVDSQGGGGGTIATEAVARSAPDGYTLVIGSLSTLVTGPILNPNVRYDPVKSFAPISMIAIAPSVLIVNPGVPANNLRELIELAKAKPGTLNFGSNGTGALPHLAAELFRSMTGVNIVHVPYKGAAPATNAVMAGQIQMAFFVPTGLEPHIRAGKLKALAVASRKRLQTLPEVPTAAEAGLPGFETYTWFGLAAPQGTPAAVVSRLNQETVRSIEAKEVHDVLAKQGMDPVAGSPGEFGQFVHSETDKWSRIIKAAGVKAEK